MRASTVPPSSRSPLTLTNPVHPHALFIRFTVSNEKTDASSLSIAGDERYSKRQFICVFQTSAVSSGYSTGWRVTLILKRAHTALSVRRITLCNGKSRNCFVSRQGEKEFSLVQSVRAGSGDHPASYSARTG